jgi:hypothetical protein
MPLLRRRKPLPLLLLPPLPLRAIVEQERQRPTKRQNNQRLEDIGVNIVAVVAVAAIEVVLVVVGLVVVPAGEFGLEEGAEPFGEGEVFLDCCGGVSNYRGEMGRDLLGSSWMDLILPLVMVFHQLRKRSLYSARSTGR